MTSQTEIPTLADLEFLPYINDSGQLPEELQSNVGVYAIFNQAKTLQFIGLSRDVFVSLKQHLVRRPSQCYWVKVKTIDRPSRAVLEEIRNSWIEQNGSIPVGNDADEAKWSHAIQVKELMTFEEQKNYTNPMNDEITQTKILKNIARRVEAEILAQLKERGVQTEIRFNPKLKEEGLLDLK
jgi:hypothetical protein